MHDFFTELKFGSFTKITERLKAVEMWFIRRMFGVPWIAEKENSRLKELAGGEGTC